MKAVIREKVTGTSEGFSFRDWEGCRRQQFTEDGDLVIRLDGKDVTKDRMRFDLTEEDGFTAAIHSAACGALKGLCGGRLDLSPAVPSLGEQDSVAVFSMMDEVSIVFREPDIFLDCFEDGNVLYDTGVFLQLFVQRLWWDPMYAGVCFGLTAYSLPAGKGTEYIRWRRRLCNESALVYLAKNARMEPELYHCRGTEAVLRNIKDAGVALPEWPGYLTGLLGTFHACGGPGIPEGFS